MVDSQTANDAEAVIATLKSIDTTKGRSRFLQSWNRDLLHLTFGCSDGQQGVIVRSDGLIEKHRGPGLVRSRFGKRTLEERAFDGSDLFQQIKGVLTSHVHFEDDRVPDLIALWIMGTYVYTVFTHFGYLFLHSK